MFGIRDEILGYLERTAHRSGAISHMRFGVEVLDARWDEGDETWHLETTDGPMSAGVLVSATGVFVDKQIPEIPGADSFAGKAFHTLDWDHEHDLRGERVAIIGTGPTTVQVVPEIQPIVRHLTVFQRSAPWILPRWDLTMTPRMRSTFRHVPATQRAIRGTWYAAIESFGLPGFVNTRFRHPYQALGLMQLRRQVRDPELRRTLTPNYMIGCKRAIFSDTYLPALTRSNVAVETSGVREIVPEGVIDRDGNLHAVDTLIWATGFRTPPRFSHIVTGAEGATIADTYAGTPKSYLGMTLAGFPNFFMTLGPYGAGGNQSGVFMIESQVRYIVDAIATMRAQGLRRVAVTHERQDAFVDDVVRRSEHSVWLTGGCQSYYQTQDGGNAGLYPNWSFQYRRRTRKFDRDAYEVSA